MKALGLAGFVVCLGASGLISSLSANPVLAICAAVALGLPAGLCLSVGRGKLR